MIMGGDLAGRALLMLSVAITAFAWGFASYHFKIFPHELIKNVYRVFYSPRHLFPVVYDRAGARALEPEMFYPNSTLITTYWREFGWRPGIKLIGINGDVLHSWKTDPVDLYPEKARARAYVHGTYLFPNGDILLNIEYAGLVRLDSCGQVIWKLDYPSTHHSISRSDDGNFWVSGNIPRLDDKKGREYLSKFAGLQAPVYEDSIINVSPDGELLQDISMLEVVYHNGLERYIVKTADKNSAYIIHLNDVESLSAEIADEYPLFEAGDVVVSLRDLHLILVLDPENKIVKWFTTEPFIEQHDPDFIGGGWIGVFDNNRDFTSRGTMLGGSRIVAVQPHTGNKKILFPTDKSEPFYTRAGGKWQLLPNGNMLLVEAQAGRAIEVAPDGRTVWEWISEKYDEKLVPEVMEATRYTITPEQLASWRCGQ